MRNYKFKIFFVLLFLFGSYISYAQDDKKEKERISFRDPNDGTFDLSAYLGLSAGFLPVPFLITEPAFGYGGGLVVAFIHPQKKKYETKVPPHISGVTGMGTQNKSWLGGAFHFHVWGPDKIRYLGLIGKPYVNFYYYGNNIDYLSNNPAKLNLDAFLLLQRVQLRTASTNLFIGLTYTFFNTKNSIDTVPDRPVVNEIINRLDGKSTISSISPKVNWDSRDNIFTTTKGLNTGLEFVYNATWLGADENFYKINTYFLGYQSVSKRVYSAWRFDGSFMLGDAPLYALPFVSLRGVPAMRYQSDNILVVETEWRLRIRKKWSVNVFTGTGKAFDVFENFASSVLVYNYGFGFKYELSRLFDMHAGLDFAWSNNGDFAFYFTMGSPWNR